MEYIVGIRTHDEEPFVCLESLNKEGKPTGEVKEEKTLAVSGVLMSNKANQLIFKTEESGGDNKGKKE